MAKIIPIYENCPACHGNGYWLVEAMKKDGTPSKRRVRYPCPRCSARGAAKPKAKNMEHKRDESIPF